MDKHFKQHLEKLFRFDSIRIQKILEITQYMFTTIFLAIFLAVKIDRYMGKYNPNDSSINLFRQVAIQAFFLVLGTYYIPKISLLIPFIFQYTKEYMPCGHKECRLGIGVALAIGFKGFQSNFKHKIIALVKRLL